MPNGVYIIKCCGVIDLQARISLQHSVVELFWQRLQGFWELSLSF